MTGCVLGMVTCSSRAEARRLARAVLAKKLAACVNVIDGLESHYLWQGRLTRAKESLLLIKTTKSKTSAVTKAIKAAHSYSVPEIVFVRIESGERSYLKWVGDSVNKSR